ncbi:MAG: lipoprotein [Rhodomicrobium sp.]|nr:MAG: lipoprotein [Rhodomicrobium sp.]
MVRPNHCFAKGLLAISLFSLSFMNAPTAHSHFQELIPSADSVTSDDPAEISLDLQFTHPMADGPRMQMDKPAAFGVVINGSKTDLMAALEARDKGEKAHYAARYKIKAPGDHIFFVKPAPYWEPDEGKMIIHYTKVIVDGFQGGEGWHKPVGLPVEIEPLSRPYGLWTGNLFRGRVLSNGKPVPFAIIEVEYRNEGGAVKLPGPAFETQEIRADANGVFSYAMPRAGWWGFAALVDGDEEMKNPEGKSVPVELGGLIWVKTEDMKASHKSVGE